jgi:hypothetical protein
MKTFVLAAALVLLAACAATYAPPTTPLRTTSATVPGKSKADILIGARRALVGNGYQITAFDDAAGIISTAPHDLRLLPELADCGTTMGIDYLKDNRTTTRVAFGVIASDGRVEVRPNIEGEYKPGSVTQNITLTCVSRGVLDQEMLQKLLAAI